MLEASLNEIKDFTKLLRKKLEEGGCHQSYINSLSDEQILEDYRVCCDCGVEIHTRDQQLRLILESNSAERAFEILYPEECEEPLLPVLYCDKNEDREYNITLMGKHIFDGATTIAEAIEFLSDFQDYLRALKDDNFELTGTVENDYGFLRRKQK